MKGKESQMIARGGNRVREREKKENKESERKRECVEIARGKGGKESRVKLTSDQL
jgi:hypothetical protein